MSDALDGIEETMMRLSAVSSAKLEALRKSQLRTDRKLAETEDRLKAFVDVLEGSITKRREPTSKTPSTCPR